MPISTAREKSSVRRIAGLVLVNAMVFQEMLAEGDKRIRTIQATLKDANVGSAFEEHWRFITEEINYYPIFNVARHILLEITAVHDSAIRDLANVAQRIVAERAALRHDLMGRVYHRLLADAKYLATYYTTIPAATMLLKLGLKSEKWDIDFGDTKILSDFKVADLACGTGTLLMAAADAIADNHIRAATPEGRLDPQGLHKALLQDVIHGYDVLPSAIQLTASTLALRAPEVTINTTNLFSLPHGGVLYRLGSIEFLRDSDIHVMNDLFTQGTAPEQVRGDATDTTSKVHLPKLDLCVMNPPFTRSVGGNLLFGSSPPAERRRMQNDLGRLIRDRKVPANATAGLGSVFVAIGHKYVKPGGRIALVLPKSVVSGVAWKKTRQLVSTYYDIEAIIVSHEPGRWNFSESTSLSEAMLIARRRIGHEGPGTGSAVVVNLWQNPRTTFEALAVTQDIQDQNLPDIEHSHGIGEISVSKRKVAEAFLSPQADFVSPENWMLLVAFAQTDVVRSARKLLSGKILVPGQTATANIDLCSLGSISALGPDRRDIYDGFDKADGSTAYPAVWGNDALRVTTIERDANAYLTPLSGPRNNRPYRTVGQLWPKASRLIIAEKLRLNTQRIVASYVAEPVLSNVWWSIALYRNVPADWAKVLALWLNSTLGILGLLAHRQETEGGWIGFKKESLLSLLVPDPDRVPPAVLSNLASAFDELRREALMPFPQMAEDPVRISIDKAFEAAYGMQDITVLREMLAREPVVCNRPLV
jgi:hypothetical protein